MKGKDLIKMIQERGLEDHEFCTTDRRCGYTKWPASDIVVWEDAADKYGYYDTQWGGQGKIVILKH